MNQTNSIDVIVRRIVIDDATKLSQFYSKNQTHFKPWEPSRSDDYHTITAWQKRLVDYDKEHQLKTSAHFAAFNATDHNIIACCSLTNVIQGPFKACYLGFGVDEDHEGKGVVISLCRYVIDIAFNNLCLNRVMANYMPENTRSKKLLTSLGFEEEGYAKRYLKINGQWRDHVLTAMHNPKEVD